MRDLHAYLQRIGITGSPTLAEVHRAHTLSIPFENLDSHQGVVPSLAPHDLEDKLVVARRGGYCFEHNLLLGAALTELGFAVEPILGRVRLGAPPGVIRGLTHLCLRVTDGDRVWHADVGYGAATLIEPIPFGPGDVHEQDGWRYRVGTDGDELVLRISAEDGWQDLYSFIPRPIPYVDIEVGNWFAGAHPSSAFVTGLIATIREPDGTHVSLTDWGSHGLNLTRATPAGRERRPVAWSEVPALLAGTFGLPGFVLGPDGRLTAG